MAAVRSTFIFSLLASVAILVAGCGPKSGQVRLAPSVDRQGQWDRVLKEHTRRNQHYDWPTLEADLRATLVTPRLRSAFILDRARFNGAVAREFGDDLLRLGKPPDEGMDAPIKSRPDAEEDVMVFISMFVRDAKHRDLDASYSIWDIELHRGEVMVTPSKVDRVRYSPGLVDMVPYVDRFDKSYFLRFPLVDPKSGQAMLSPGGEPLRLRIVSALGEVITEWKMVEGDGAVAATAAVDAPATDDDQATAQGASSPSPTDAEKQSADQEKQSAEDAVSDPSPDNP